MVLRKLTKEEAKEEVKKLVDKYNRIVESGSIKRYKEEDTKAEFIEPLFEALGWDVRNTENDDEVVREEKISKGRVDYSFRINGIPKFFLEAKALKEDLDNIQFVEQAVNYSWHKGCTWAVLTDFEAIKIFNAEWKSANPLQAQFGQTLPCQLFLEKFDTLWLLSRESFEKKLLDIEAEKWGKKIKKTSVDKQLLSDLTRFRDLLNKNILKNNASKNISGDELDEAVQRIIDRLIFIRTLEDKELEAPMLQSVIREDLNKRIYKKLNPIFRKIDDIYNSKLFTPHLCEDLDIDDEVLSKIIGGLFATTDNTVRYDFSAIDADVLGNIYEQYLGHILKKTDKRAKLAEGKAHRKEQGIYYTPTYVVDYIVKNTVGELAKDKKFDLKNVKILDPACGSGSFLMKAFDYLVTLDKKKNGEVDQTKFDLSGASASYGRKVEILKNNIFGVDLDPKAVEIAQLNLLLKAAEKKHRLPTLQENIKVGNSLIDDPAIAGNRAFKWEEQFNEIIADGGFDVVIGNPPYIPIESFSDKDKEYYFSKYKSPYRKFDTVILFVEKGLSLLKEGGLISFIVPLTWQTGENYAKFRQVIFSQCNLKCLLNLPFDVFPDAYVDTGIFILEKKKTRKNKFIAYAYDKKTIISKIENIPSQKIEQEFVDSDPEKKVFTNRFIYTMLNKIKNDSIPLGDISDSCQGIVVSKFPISTTKLNDYYKKLLTKGAGNRYVFEIEEVKYIDYSKAMTLYKYYSVPRIFIRRIINRKNRLMAFLYAEPLITKKDYNPFILTSEEYKLEYLLGLINSKLFSYIYIYSSALATKDDFRQTTLAEIRKLPVKKANLNSQEKIASKVKNITELNELLLAIKNKQTDQKAQLEKEIQRLDNEIDEEVYKLYGITDEEKKIIEDSLK